VTTDTPRVVAILPALDEEPAVGLVVAELAGRVSEIVVVDNGSRDRTAQVAGAAGARVVREPRRGYGHACLAGIAAADGAGILVFLDADHSDDPSQLEALLAPIRAGEADLVVGSRRLGRRAKGSHPWHAVLGTRVCVALMNRVAGTRATDLGPFRAITRQALERLDLRERTFGWTVDMQLQAARRGLRVAEVPVDYRPRLGQSKVSGTLSGSVRAGAGILGVIARHALGRAR
jgi:glycosyltransferase involved in cell wall biosynthesis